MKTSSRRYRRLAHLDAIDHDPLLAERLPQRRSDAEADRLLAILDKLPSAESKDPHTPITPYEP
jgi:hypothetical protein